MILTIDPNLRGCGCALFDDHGELLRAAYVKNPIGGRGYPAHSAVAFMVCRWVALSDVHSIIEFPRYYPGAQAKTSQMDPNDLLDVAGVGAACAALLQEAGRIKHVFPSEWKGTVKKSVMLERIVSRLSPEELDRCAPCNKSDREDMLDAVGIGLWHFNRLTKRLYPGAS